MPVGPNFDPANLYFITTTAIRHKHVFQRDVIKRILTDSLNHMRARHWVKLHVFVIMPNHVHIIVRFLEDHTLANVMREFKKFTARQIIRQHEAEGNQEVLAFFEQMAAHRPRQKYKVWQDSYDARDIFSPEFLRQKATYCHDNPCQPQWHLVERPEQYPWSSARFYILGEPAIIPVDDVGELLA